MIAFGLVATSWLFAGQNGAEAQMRRCYEERRWFALRDAIGDGEAALPYRAAVALAFDEVAACEHAANALLAAPASPETAIAAHDVLGDLYFRHGRFRDALAQAESGAALRRRMGRPGDDNPLLRAFTRFPDLAVTAHRPSSIRVPHNNAFVPVTINDRRFHCLLDTGANLSVVTESAVKALGLAVVEVSGVAVVDSTGGSGDLKQVAVADRLVLGDIHLAHVPFMVVSDRAQPFIEWSADQRCVLGIQVLLACRTLRWKKSGAEAALELGVPSAPRDRRAANLCFDAAMPHVAATFAGRPLDLVLDTGADDSVLDPLFAAEFAVFVQANGRKSTKEWEGLVEKAIVETIQLPEFSLQVGGITLWWRPMEIRPPGKHADRFHGVLGGEIMKPLREVTIDFGAMKFSLR